MRICLVSSAYRPYISGVGEHVYHLARQLKYLGHEVHILTTNYRFKNPEHNSWPLTRLGRGLRLQFAQGEFTLPFALGIPKEVNSFLKQHNFDLVHCHGIFPPELAYWAAHYTDRPVAVTFHAVTPRLPKYAGNIFQRLFYQLGQKIKAKIAVSHACKRWAEMFFPGDFCVIPNGVDIDEFHPDVPPAIPAGDPAILYVGRLEKRKGLDILLNAFLVVKNEIPGVKLIVVGFGPLKNHYTSLVYKLKINDSVSFVGPVANDQLRSYYTRATVYVAPTINPEAMGIVIIEAMACACPVIASDIPGYNEIITHGINGILVPPRNHQALARAIINVIKSKDYQKYLGQEARLRAKDFDWKKIARKIETIYQEVV